MSIRGPTEFSHVISGVRAAVAGVFSSQSGCAEFSGVISVPDEPRAEQFARVNLDTLEFCYVNYAACGRSGTEQTAYE